MPVDYTVFEIEILNFVREQLTKHAKDLKNLGIVPKIEDIRKRSQPSYQSEMEVTFSDQNGIFAVMEFFMYENSKPSASKEEIEAWIKDFFKDLLKGKPDY